MSRRAVTRRARARHCGPRDPFADLGLDPEPGITDDEVRAAWRRIATATHPDRSDGGDPARYAAAAAAYYDLRTSYGRGEALAGRTDGPSGGYRHASPGRDAPGSAMLRMLARVPYRVARGRPGRLALKCAVTGATCWLALTAGATRGAGPALAVGALTWLILTARRDLAP